jgi:hypothetical protein
MTPRLLLVDEDKNWLIAISGAQVTQCYFDYGVILLISNRDIWVKFRIGGRVTMHHGQESTVFDSEKDNPSITNFCHSLIHQDVYQMKAGKEGTLTIALASGITLTIPPDEQFEAWEATSEHQEFTLVSIPGGGLAVWESPATGS